MALLNKEDIRILIIDDDESIVQFLQMGLENEGFIVHTAFNGNDAVILAKEFNPHIVVLDVMLPGMNGYEVCSKIKKSIKTSIIMLTARDDIDDRVRSLNLGADDYMVKPFNFKELLTRINASV